MKSDHLFRLVRDLANNAQHNRLASVHFGARIEQNVLIVFAEAKCAQTGRVEVLDDPMVVNQFQPFLQVFDSLQFQTRLGTCG